MRKQSNPQTKMLALVLGLATWFAVPMVAMAEKLPDYNSAAGMLKIGKNPERPDAEIFHIAYTLNSTHMLHYAIVFIVIALIAAFLGFGSLAGTAAMIAKVCFGLFLIFALFAFLKK